MSDLGSSELNPIGAVFFNLACIIGGIMLFPFFIGFYEWYIGGRRNKNLTIATQISGFMSAFCLIMIGVFSVDTMILHIIWAGTLFFVNIMTFILPAIALYQFSFTRSLAKFAIFAAIVNISLFVISFPIIEWVTIIVSFTFIGLLIHNMRKRIEKYRFIRKSGIEIPSKKQRKKKKAARIKAKEITS
jgi:hypothetical protein